MLQHFEEQLKKIVYLDSARLFYALERDSGFDIRSITSAELGKLDDYEYIRTSSNIPFFKAKETS